MAGQEQHSAVFSTLLCGRRFLHCRIIFSELPAFSLKSLEISLRPFGRQEAARPCGGEAARISSLVKDFLEGRIRKLPTEDLDLSGLGDFDRKILRELRRNAPYGGTISYSELAKSAGSPLAARAAGNALNRNPFPLFFPCHRVIKADGSIGGFGSGTELKKLLLENERKIAGHASSAHSRKSSGKT